jgi:biotin operon repressor
MLRIPQQPCRSDHLFPYTKEMTPFGRSVMDKDEKSLSLPWLFGRGGRDRALICLAVNGPLTVREVSRATGIDSRKMWDMIERLRVAGLVVKRDVQGGRKYVYLNRRLPIYRRLLALLLALDREWPAQRVGDKTARWRMPFHAEMGSERLDHIFQSPLRSRVLLFVAATKESDQETIYETLGLAMTSVWLAVNHWEKQGILTSRPYKRRRLISLDRSFIVAKELYSLLRVTVAYAGEYRSLRDAVNRKK